MANTSSADGLVSLIGNTFYDQWKGYNESTTNRTALFSGGGIATLQRAAFFAWPSGTTTPSLPGTVTSYLVTEVTPISTGSNNLPYIFGELINLGSLNLNGGGGGSFSDGSAMPTRTVLGTSKVLDSPIIAEVTTALSAAPGTFTLTVTDDTGASVSSNAMTPTNSSTIGSCGFVTVTSGTNAFRDITAATTTGTGTGVIQFWGIIPISTHVLNPVSSSFTDDLLSQGRIVRLGAGKTLGAFQIGAVTAMASKFYIQVLGDQ